MFRLLTSSSLSLTGSLFNFLKTFDEETDNLVRNCKVFIDFEDIIPNQNGTFSHWAAIFQFEDRTVRYEMVRQGDKLRPSWFELFLGFSKREKIVEIGQLQISPRFIYESARDLDMNYTKYHAMLNNCQDWVMNLLDAVGLDARSAMRRQDVKRLNPLSALGLGG